MLKKLCISLGLSVSIFSINVATAQQDGYWQQAQEQQQRQQEEQRLNQERQQWEENNRNAASKATSNAAGSQGGFASAPKVTVVDKFGAVAWNNHGGFDSAFGKNSQIEANHEALSKCGSDCRITTTYANQCAAMAYGASKVNKKVLSGSLNVSDNYRVAERGALAKCSLKADNCKLWLSECSTMNDSSSKM